MERELLYRFFSGRASVAEEKIVLDWLDKDPAHQKQMLAERRLFDAVLMHAKPGRSPKAKIFPVPRWVRETVKYAAVLIVAAGVGGAYFSSLHDRLAQSYNTIAVPAGQHVDVTLPDGTKVCMNALSELRYPSSFIGGRRKVQLRGEAFFDVSHDERHPFVVETYACDVEVLGTKFDVEAHPETDRFVASLVEGCVRITDRTASRNQVVLQPEHRALRSDGRLVVERIPDHEQFQWREGLIAFRDASFRELLGEFEKYYGVKIVVQRDVVTDDLFTGKIRIAEGIDHALWVLQQNAEFTYTRNETKDILYIR